MDAKVILFFRQYDAGWSEVYYWRGPDGTPLPVYDDIDQLVNRRLNLLLDTCVVQAVRVERLLSLRPSDDPQPVNLVSFWDQFDLDGRRHDTHTYPSICIIANSYPVDGPGWKITYMHGCPFPFVDYGRQTAAFGVISDAGAAYFTRWSQVLLGTDPDYSNRGEWCVFRSSDSDDDAGRNAITDINYTSGPGFYWQIEVAEEGHIRTNDLVTVGRVRGCGIQGLNQEHWVKEVAGDTVTLWSHYMGAQALDAEFTLDAYIRAHVYELSPIGKVYYRRTSTRDMGRRFHRYSWAPKKIGQKVGVHPCGIAMDFLRSGYKVNMRTFRSGPLPEEVVWFRQHDLTPMWLSETPFRSLNWRFPHRNEEVGEQSPWDPKCRKIHGPWYTGKTVADFPGNIACGSPLAWHQGATPGDDPVIEVPADLIPQCCKGPGMTATIRIGKGWTQQDYATDCLSSAACGIVFPLSIDIGYILNRYCTLMVIVSVVIGDDEFLPNPPTWDAGWMTLVRSHVEVEWAAYLYMGVVPADGTAYPTYTLAEGTIVAAAAMLADRPDAIAIGNEAWSNEGPGWFAPILGSGSDLCYQVWQFVASLGDPSCPGPASAYCELYEAPVKYGLPVLPLPSDATTAWWSISLIQVAVRGGQWGSLTSGFVLQGPGCQDAPPAGYMRATV